MQKNIPVDTALFKQHKTHTPEEIIKAGGATIFGHQSGKNNDKLISALEAAPISEPFNDEEWQYTLKQLSNKGE